MYAARLTRLAPAIRRVHTSAVRLAQAPAAPVTAPHQPFETPADLKGKAVGQVDLPDMNAIERVERDRPKIPTAPDTYRAPSSSPDAEPAPYVEPPKVSTAAHPSTLPGGGPSLQHSGDDSIATGGEGVGGEKGGHGGREQRYEYEDRSLNDDERMGLYSLAGIAIGGYTLSWLTDPTRRKHLPTPSH